MNRLWKMGGHVLPEIWKDLVPEDVQAWDWPEEKLAQCGRCPQVGKKGYHPIYRCCTFIPRMPNYLLGLAARDSVLLKTHVESLVDNGYLTPEGLHHNPAQWVLALENDAINDYGKSPRLLCPNLDQGNGLCKVYAYRNAACATFFCENDHGSRGAYLWDGLNDTMGRVEFRLMQWALEQIGFDFARYLQAYDSLMTVPLEHSVDPVTKTWTMAARRTLWGEWFGREMELLEATAKVVTDNREKLKDLIQTGGKYLPFTKEQNSLSRLDADDADDAEEDWDEISLDDSWQGVRKLYPRVWAKPVLGETYVLGQRVSFERNELKSAADRYFSDKPYRVWKNSRLGKLAWDLYFTNEDFAALQLVIGCGQLTPEVFEAIERLGVKSGERVVSEWITRSLIQLA